MRVDTSRSKYILSPDSTMYDDGSAYMATTVASFSLIQLMAANNIAGNMKKSLLMSKHCEIRCQDRSPSGTGYCIYFNEYAFTLAFAVTCEPRKS